MFALFLHVAEPDVLMLFGLLFLAGATGMQIKLARKHKGEGREADLLGSESSSLQRRR
jgi:hypothetical protein